MSFIFAAGADTAKQAADPDIRLNQAGYYTNSRKVAVVIDNANTSAATGFRVLRASDRRTVLHEIGRAHV
jgi:hypothetical protein